MESSRSPTAESPKAEIACIVCRSRKVRCNRSLPFCGNCRRLGVSCPGYDSGQRGAPRSQILKSTEEIFKAAGKERRRIGSCELCRRLKHHCTRTRPSCQRCLMRGLRCVYGSKDDGDSAEGSHSGAGLNAEPSGTKLPTPSQGPQALEISGLQVHLDTLCSGTLPGPALRSRLITAYFERTHPLRCLAFIHKPSFMRAIDRASLSQEYGEPLLYVICALGIRVILSDSVRCGTLDTVPARPTPGEAWAEEAREKVLLDAHVPTIQSIMTMLLLCEYALRTDQYALVFTLSGSLFRALRLLGLDSPSNPPAGSGSPTDRLTQETKGRLVWACYHLDLLLSSGVDKHSLWRDDYPRIPLPCSNQDFLTLSHSAPSYLSQLEAAEALPAVGEFDMPALITVLIRLRSTVLRLIRTAPSMDTSTLGSTSPFMSILQRLDVFHSSIPEKFRLSDLNLYMQEEQHLAGAVFSLHLMYHAAIVDLTRITLAGFNFPLAEAFTNSSARDFRLHCQMRCRFHASEVSSIIKKGLSYGKSAFDEPFCADFAMESAKAQIIYSATVENTIEMVDATRDNLRINLRLLEMYHAGKDGHSPHIRTLLPLCMVFGYRDVAEEWQAHQACSAEEHVEVTGDAAYNHLSITAPFRKARRELPATPTTPSSESSGPRAVTGQAKPSFSVATPASIVAAPGEASEPGQATYGAQQPTTRDLEPRHPPHPDNSGGTRWDVVDMEMPMPDNLVQPSMEDYIRTANSMNTYLTWDMSELPPYPLFNLSGVSPE